MSKTEHNSTIVDTSTYYHELLLEDIFPGYSLVLPPGTNTDALDESPGLIIRSDGVYKFKSDSMSLLLGDGTIGTIAKARTKWKDEAKATMHPNARYYTTVIGMEDVGECITLSSKMLLDLLRITKSLPHDCLVATVTSPGAIEKMTQDLRAYLSRLLSHTIVTFYLGSPYRIVVILGKTGAYYTTNPATIPNLGVVHLPEGYSALKDDLKQFDKLLLCNDRAVFTERSPVVLLSELPACSSLEPLLQLDPVLLHSIHHYLTVHPTEWVNNAVLSYSKFDSLVASYGSELPKSLIDLQQHKLQSEIERLEAELTKKKTLLQQ